MRAAWLLAAAAGIALAAPARAEVIDMAAITCEELLGMTGDDAGAVLVWVHGYFGGKNDDTGSTSRRSRRWPGRSAPTVPRTRR
jgi:hypothetical protein